MVTFSDCMTLLLCFFVILMTFSSFDDAALSRLAGSFDYRAVDSPTDIKRTIKDSVVPPRPRQMDRTQVGSEQPAEELLKSIKNPRKPLNIAFTDAYRDKKLFHIASGSLFWGNGSSFVQSGRDRLRMIASFMTLVPCQVVIAEIPGAEESEAALDRGLERAWSVMDYFTVQAALPAKRFHISATHGQAPERFAGQAVMEITLLAGSVYE
ncbi:MAG: hypothetical protein AMJ81_00380 [Phycisphaerae bacterium SM23_33]|nr:MAG: hypothetical protein AMJ81_00380 [Phycisphaerae bacterium SM23_33]